MKHQQTFLHIFLYAGFMIDPVALRSLIAVRDHGSVVAAAAALGFTPSAVSQHVKRIESHSRQPMLERVGRGVVLTERAQQLADRGAWLLAELDGLDRLVQSPDDVVAGTVRLATFATACRGLVAPLLPRLGAAAPQLRVQVLEDDPREIVRAVAQGQAELGIVHDWTSMRLDLPPELDSAPLLVDRADMLVHRDHPLSGRRRVTPGDLAGEHWAITPAGTICHDWLLEMYAQHGMRPDLRYEADDYATHVALVAEDVAIALVPRLGRVVLPDEVVVVEVVDPTPERTVQLVWRHTAANSAARALVHRELEAVVAERWA
jgi:DNA-binding transcriptional LysR family regulator